MSLPKAGMNRSVCLLGAILFLAYGCAVAGKSFAGFAVTHSSNAHWPWLGDKPVGEDGFYMLTVADNLAVTHHLVYNQGMPATGIQPLATLIFAGIAFAVHHLGGDRWTLVRAVIILGSVLFLFFAWMVASIASDLAPPMRQDLVFAFAFCLTLFDFTAFRLFTYGLETGVYLCLVAVCMIVWRRLVATPKAGWIDMLAFGAAAGFAGLARIDFGLLFVFLLAFLLFKRIAGPLQILASGFIALAIVSPWFVFVHRVSGNWLPSSGKAESLLVGLNVLGRVLGLILSATAHLAPWSYAGSGNFRTTFVGLVSLAPIALLLLRGSETRGTLRSSSNLRATFLPWMAGISATSLVYMTFFWSIHFYTRYLSPILIFSVPLLALALAELHFLQRHKLVLPITLALFFCLWDIPSLHTGRIGSSQFISAGYIHEAFPYARVGAFQSGTVGYFNPNVENLDGKLSLGALRAAQEHRLESFIDSEHIDVLVDWQGYIDELSADYRSRVWETCPQAMPVPDSICLIRKTTRSATPVAEPIVKPR